MSPTTGKFRTCHSVTWSLTTCIHTYLFACASSTTSAFSPLRFDGLTTGVCRRDSCSCGIHDYRHTVSRSGRAAFNASPSSKPKTATQPGVLALPSNKPPGQMTQESGVYFTQWPKFLYTYIPKMHHYTVVMPDPPEEKCDYPRGIHTLMMILQLVLGGVCIGLVANMGSYQAKAVLADHDFTVNAFISFGESTALMMISYGCMMTTFLLLASSLISIRTFYHVPKSAFFVLYHLLSAALFLACGLPVVIFGYQRRYEQTYITAGALGIVNAIFYLFSACLGLRALQPTKGSLPRSTTMS